MIFSSIERPVVLEAETGTIEKADWMVARSCGYSSEQQAKEIGEKFREALILSGVIGRSGVDCGFDRTGLQFSQDIVDQVRKSTGAEMRGSIHGLDIFEEGKVAHVTMRATGIVLTPLEMFQKNIETAMLLSPGMLSERRRIAASLINDSFFVPNLDVAFVIRVSAIEALCEQHTLSDSQLKLLGQLSNHLMTLTANDDDKFVVQKALDNERRQGVRNAYMSKLLTLLSLEDAKRFDDLYGKRGEFVHDGRLRGQLSQAAEEALDIAMRLLWAEMKVK